MTLVHILGSELGAVVLTGDYRFDHTPIDGRITDVNGFARISDHRGGGSFAARPADRPRIPAALTDGPAPSHRWFVVASRTGSGLVPRSPSVG